MKNGKAQTGKFIAVANMKGGVGKTTTVVSLAEALAADNPKISVLVVDLDPQASASLCLAKDDLLADIIERGLTLQNFLNLRLVKKDAKRPVDEFIRPNVSSTMHQGEQLKISLLPCGPELRVLERALIHVLTKRRLSMDDIQERLWDLFQSEFAPLRKAFDFVIFDCPPGISPFAEVTIRGSDLVIVPTIPDRISNFGLNAFCYGLWQTESGILPTPPLPYVLISRMQSVGQHKQMAERLTTEADAKDAAFRLFKTRVPQSTPLAKALNSDGIQTFTARYSLGVAQILATLTNEIKESFDANRH